jgi:alanine-glyoxylate transaminase/serine-glyoxylate transaminase/serine-pyruvate transaminase
MSHRSGRHFLQIPGPTNVPDRILRAMDLPTMDHRGPDFGAMTRELLHGLKGVFRTEDPVVIYPASGTGAWEAALVNTLSPGDRVLMFETGHFATLWRQLAERLGLKVDFVAGDWRRGVDPEALEAKLAEDRGHEIKAVCAVHNETSTGVTSRIAELRQAIDRAGHPALFMVDTISSLASIDYRHDDWGVDVTVAGSQKGLMLPPGLSFNAISNKALEAAEAARLPKSYWGWPEMLAANAKGYFPYTPATNLLYGLRESIAMLNEEGLDAVFARHAGAALRRRTGVQQLADRRADALGPRRRRLPRGVAGKLRHVARQRAGQGRRQGVPDRPPGRFQRADAGRHPVRGRDGPGRDRSATQQGRRAGGARLPMRPERKAAQGTDVAEEPGVVANPFGRPLPP